MLPRSTEGHIEKRAIIVGWGLLYGGGDRPCVVVFQVTFGVHVGCSVRFSWAAQEIE